MAGRIAMRLSSKSFSHLISTKSELVCELSSPHEDADLHLCDPKFSINNFTRWIPPEVFHAAEAQTEAEKWTPTSCTLCG
jgi:hypothetical protein